MTVKLIRLNGKIPVDRDWPSKGSDDPREHQAWLSQGFDLGLLTGNGLVVIDLDDKTKARRFYQAHRSILKTVVETRRGIHCYYRGSSGNRVKVDMDGFTVDVRGEHGCVVFPPSVVQGFRYRFVNALVPVEELPPLPVLGAPVIRDFTVAACDKLQAICRARAYVAKVEGAVSGQGGHAATYRVACKLRSFGLSESEAWPILLEYSERCVPPWSVRELRHKLLDAMRSTHGKEIA